MLEQIHVSADGVKYRLIATRPTTPATESEAKQVRVQTATIEVIISDSQFMRFGSQFGHAAIVVNGIAYSRAPRGYDAKRTRTEYISDQQAFRDSTGYLLRVSPHEENAIETELKRRVELYNRDPMGHGYSLFGNSCSSNVADVLRQVGILAHDPRGFGVVSPADLAAGLSHSKRVKERRLYRRIGS